MLQEQYNTKPLAKSTASCGSCVLYNAGVDVKDLVIFKLAEDANYVNERNSTLLERGCDAFL
jgi:hypothetical protein